MAEEGNLFRPLHSPPNTCGGFVNTSDKSMVSSNYYPSPILGPGSISGWDCYPFPICSSTGDKAIYLEPQFMCMFINI